MTLDLREEVIETLREALRVPFAQGGGALDRALEGLHAADIAEAMRELTPPECLAIFNWLDNERAADLLGELDSELVRYVTENAPTARIADLLDRLPMDDAAEVVSESTPERAEEMLSDLARLAPADAAEVRELLSYEEGTAGRLMTDKFLAVSPESTVEMTMGKVREASKDIETLTDIYVVPNPRYESPLMGVLSLRDLILASPDQFVTELMVDDPVSCSVDDDQQSVAKLISKYDLHALPVLDRQGDLVGIITVDDVIDVLVEEFTEDYLRLVGSDAEEMDRRSPIQVARLRLPWLLGTLLIELCAGLVISHFNHSIVLVPLLASFMPVISAISGNVGLQAAAIVVRGLDTGHVSLDRWWRSVSKELAASLLMAVACGIVLGTVGAMWSGKATFGLVIGGAMSCSMLTAGFMGTIVPMISKKLGFDPAATAGPFETAFQDVIGFGVFLWLATLLIPWIS